MVIRSRSRELGNVTERYERTMRSLEEIYALAAERKGGGAALEAILAETPSRASAEIAAVPNDRLLSEMMRRIFHAGLSWKMLDGK